MDTKKGFLAHMHRLTTDIDIILARIPVPIAGTIAALNRQNFDATNQVYILKIVAAKTVEPTEEFLPILAVNAVPTVQGTVTSPAHLLRCHMPLLRVFGK